MAAVSYVECRTWDEVMSFCKNQNLLYTEEKVYLNGIAKATNESGCMMAYLVERNSVKVGNIKDETKWIWILE